MSRATRIRDNKLGVYVERTAAVPPGTGTSEDLFSVTGEVLLTGFYGLVTVAIPNESIDLDLAHDPDDGGSDVVLATALAVDADPTGTWYRLNATAGGALVDGLDAAYGVALATPIALVPGDIKLNVTGGGAIGTAARVRWGAFYIPISDAGQLVAV